MLKIRDNVDLKELEKYGLVKKNIYDDKKLIAKDVYCLINDDNLEENYNIEDYLVECFFNEGKIFDTCNYGDVINWQAVIEIIYDLTKANLIEKVKE